MDRPENENTNHDSVNPDYRYSKQNLKSAQEYADGIRSGDRTLLSRAITLIESTNEGYRERGQEILEMCLDQTGNSIRIGITGVPGVGKSTFIEALGRKLAEEGEQIAVLTVDPSSSQSGGSILGDKTRMPQLASHANAYIRPSPASGSLGGVAAKTRETMLLCEAAGFTTIFVETVGVGQSETAVRSMVDFFLLLMLAGAGDELQGMKRGIMEMADLIAINKADGENLKSAKQAKLEYLNALSLFPPRPSGWKPVVRTCSALHNDGIDEIRNQMQKYMLHVRENGYFKKNRKEQAVFWMYETIETELKRKFYNHPGVRRQIRQKENAVQSGNLDSVKAARELIRLFEFTSVD